MRISDWSSDVCSSDLNPRADSHVLRTRAPLDPKVSFDLHVLGMPPAFVLSQDQTLKFDVPLHRGGLTPIEQLISRSRSCTNRSEERRVGKECRSKCRSRGSQYH